MKITAHGAYKYRGTHTIVDREIPDVIYALHWNRETQVITINMNFNQSPHNPDTHYDYQISLEKKELLLLLDYALTN